MNSEMTMEQMSISADEVITKADAQQCRHKLEKRWYRRLVVINIIMVAVVIGAFVKNFGGYNKKVHEYIEENTQTMTQAMEGKKAAKTESKAEKKDDKFEKEDLPWDVKALLTGIGAVIGLYVFMTYQYAKNKANALRITEKNFPEVYNEVCRQAKKLGMKKVPEVYVVQASGVLNAFSTFCLSKQYITIHSEVFEMAYREHHDMESLSFIIAHEMSHIYYGHAKLTYQLSILFSSLIPVLSDTASRAREYSCDRLAQKITGNDGIDSMFMLMVDRHLYKMIDREDYIENAESQKGFYLWVSNLLADHPVPCKRIPALAMGEGSGKLY